MIIAYDDGDPVKFNTTTVEISVLQPSVIPRFTQDEYRYCVCSIPIISTSFENMDKFALWIFLLFNLWTISMANAG